MSTKNKNIASQALLEMETIKSTIKDESKNMISALLKEAVKDAINDSIEDDSEDEKDYEVLDGDNQEQNDAEPENSEEQPADDEQPEAQAEEDPAAEDEQSDEQDADAQDDEQWNAFKDFKVGNTNTYDLTSEEDYDNVVKVYKLLSGDDQVVVKKDGDKVTLKDGENNTEYVIDLGCDDCQGECEANDKDGLNEGLGLDSEEPAGFPDENLGDDASLEDDFNEFEDDEDEDDLSFNNNNLKDDETMSQMKEPIFEIDLGYTDNYQDKDPIEGLSNNEPSKSGKSWDKVPTGTEKPWAGNAKAEGEPFKQEVKEEVAEEPMGAEEPIEEITSVQTRGQRDMGTKTHIPANRKENGPKPKHHISTAEGGYDEVVNEMKSKLAKIVKENKQLKSIVVDLRDSLKEAALTNVNLGQIVKLISENTTSVDEKTAIINRFANEAKSVEQSKALYESIKKELNKKTAKTVTLDESVASVPSQTLNEEKSSYKPKELLDTIDLMRRVNNC